MTAWEQSDHLIPAPDDESNPYTWQRSIIAGMSGMIKLNPREELIQRALAMTDDEVRTILDFLEQLEDLEDIAVSESRKDEVGIPFDEAIQDMGFDPERLEKIARAEGWMK